jgi:hypothetical protein
MGRPDSRLSHATIVGMPKKKRKPPNAVHNVFAPSVRKMADATTYFTGIVVTFWAKLKTASRVSSRKATKTLIFNLTLSTWLAVDDYIWEKQAVNLPHAPLGPLHGCGDHSLSRVSSVVKQIFRRLEATGNENARPRRPVHFTWLEHLQFTRKRLRRGGWDFSYNLPGRTDS